MKIGHNLTITPFLWFDNNLEEAVNYYTSIFEGSTITSMNRSGEAGPGPKGSLFSATFELAGQKFYGLNGGPMFKFTEAISLFISCETQDEVDELWEKLSEGGEKSRCGWLKDKFGLSWQVVPNKLGELMYSKDSQKAGKVMQAMMKMDKIIIKDLEEAYNS